MRSMSIGQDSEVREKPCLLIILSCKFSRFIKVSVKVEEFRGECCAK